MQPSASGAFSDTAVQTTTPLIALVGNPNCGKTTLFNALTGLRQKVGNYPGVTVEKKIGKLRVKAGVEVDLIDLPGLYSLTPRSPDEAIAHDVLLGHQADVPRPDAIIHVVDASNLERNLYLTSQVLDIGLPTIIVLTMTDLVTKSGGNVDAQQLTRLLGVPVCVVVASQKRGLDTLKSQLSLVTELPVPPIRDWGFSELVDEIVIELTAAMMSQTGVKQPQGRVESIGLLTQVKYRPEEQQRWPVEILTLVQTSKARLTSLGVDFGNLVIESRYAWVRHICAQTVTTSERRHATLSDRIDHIVTHKFWGFVIFFGVMSVVFQSIFSWANVPMDLIASGVTWLSEFVTRIMPPGDLRDLIVSGVIAGVGTTITFLPQILLLFLFISLLEDTGYMARAAFLMDRIMSKVGLHGKSFIPLLSSFACAIPGIMATRTIDDRKTRLVTILVAPLMSCSARIPVYTLMIGAFIPARRVLGIFTLPGLTMMAMYFLGMAAAFCMALLFKRTLLRGEAPLFFLEMPPYHKPSLRTVLMSMFERAYLFLRRAGTVILAVSIILWFLSSYPKSGVNTPPQQRLAHSYAGSMGHAIEPLIRPLGFDWRIGVSLVSSFVAREVFVSSMGTIYSVGATGSQAQGASLQDKLRKDPTFSPLLAVCVMVYYVLAMQCLSTIAVVKRETNGWKWPLFMIGYMTVLAWTVTFCVYRIGTALHLGV